MTKLLFLLVSEMESFIDRVYFGMRACLMACIPLLAHVLFIPMLIFAITHLGDVFDFNVSELFFDHSLSLGKSISSRGLSKGECRSD